MQDKLRERVSVKDFGVVGDGVTDETLKVQKAIDSLADFQELDLNGLTIRLKKGAAHPAYPNNDQPCVVVYNKVGVTIKNGKVIVLEHGQGAFDVNTSVGVKLENVVVTGPGSFPPIDGTTGRAEKGTVSAGYYDTVLYNSEAVRNNSVNTSGYATGGYGGAFPQWGGGTASTWGVWNGGYIQNFGYGIYVVGSSFVDVVGCDISGFNGSAVCIKNSSDVTVEKNKLHDCYMAGVELRSTVLTGSNFYIRGNSIYSNGHPSASRTHSYIDPGYGFCTNNPSNSTSMPKNIVVSGNTFTNNKRKGVDSHGHDGLVVESNLIQNSAFGVACSSRELNNRTIVLGNTIRYISNGTSELAYGILVSGGATANGTATVTGNVVEEVGTPPGGNTPDRGFTNGYGVCCLLLETVSVSGNVVANKTYFADVGVTISPSASSYVDYASVGSNTVVGNFRDGAYIGVSASTKGTSVCGNVINLSNIASLTAASNQVGMRLDADYAVSGNNITVKTPSAVIASKSLGDYVTFRVTLPGCNVSGIRMYGRTFASPSISASSNSYGVQLTLDSRFQSPTSSSVAVGTSTLNETSVSKPITRIYERELSGGPVIGLIRDDYVANTWGHVAGANVTGDLLVTIRF